MKTVIAFLLLLAACSPAQGSLSRAVLGGIGANPPPDAHLDLTLGARDASGRWRNIGAVLAGRPAFLVFVDYTCNTLCGTDLLLLADAIERSRLRSDRFRLVVFGIDPKDTANEALAMARTEIPYDVRSATVLLLPDPKAIARATKALGFRFAYDRGADQFAHPAVIYVLGHDGRLRNTLSPFALTGNLDRMLDSQRPSLTFYDRIKLICYGYDAAHGIYTLRIERLLAVAAAATTLLIACGILGLTYLRARAL